MVHGKTGKTAKEETQTKAWVYGANENTWGEESLKTPPE